ncbi:unnamed protein product [Fusarium graminearum]|uniref:NFX1-type zinc finger-containing protein 1 n=1 Tax=Gibberella zeae TaxID=5518 RepID=A0A9N8RF22_GIBZA|nr:unnamed protein product [Fusarium graminearum]
MASQGRGGGPSNSRTKPCQHFKKGNCYYGENCTFLHEKSSDIDSYVAIQTPVAKTDPRKRYMAWKGMVRKPPPSFQTTSGVKEHHKFWKRALELLDEDNPAQHQDIARDLANDDYHGLQFIVDAAENGSSDAKENLPTSYVFIQVISHANLMSSLSTEACVGTIFTVFAGMNGERGIGLFSSMCEQALESTELFSELLGTTTQAALRVIITALSQLLNKVPRTQFCDELPDLIEQMDKVISMIAEDAPPKELEEVSAHFKLLKRLVTAANDRLAASEDTSDKPKNLKAIASTFPRDLEIPGGRHDNDFADISKIAILPTYEEVTSEQVEYLPSTNFTEPHVLADPLQRYIDSMFRLVRHDILGPVKDILRDLLQSDDLLNGRLSNPDPQAQVYLESSIEAFVSSKKHGTEAVLSFEPPAQILGKTAEQQKAWWKTSSRLGQGTLVCFVSPTPGRTSLLFFQVTCKSTSSSDLKETDERTSSIAPLQGLPSITVKLANHNREDLLLLAKLYTTKAVGVLVDFNGVILDTFVPILRNLQTIKCENQIAFQQWILPSTDEERSVTTPAYARRLDFTFSLRSITKDKGTDLVLDPEFPENLDIQELERATGLDQGQCRGLVDALTREYALIQGPPGTGKSYLGVQLLRVLLAAKQKAHLGPIVIICYTNHALDQFLEHLFDVGISRIIRIGGRSVTPELAGLNLRVVSQETPKTFTERMTLATSFRQIDLSSLTASGALESLRSARNRCVWNFLKGFLQEEAPNTYEQFEKGDEDFTVVGGDPMETWLGSQTRANSEETPDTDLEERRALVNNWSRRHQEEQTDVLFEAMDEYEEQQKNIKRTHDATNVRTMNQADVIGLTTTALAGRIDMLRSLKPKIVICEEAGEVKESDIISALMPGLQQVIQIGDHKQLRPNINNYDLSLESMSGQKWQLDRSQFERRGEGEPGLDPSPLTQLNVQRRMRPEVSQLIRGVYPNLIDHESVLEAPDVVGMLDNVFWLDHSHPQDVGGDGTRVKSHSNRWETSMATALIRHLVRQGKYKAEDIALLTPYMGQLQQLRTALSRDFEICLGDLDREQLAHEEFEDESSSKKPVEKKKLLQTIRLATVDNFQGEEAKIIVVSLVRSNPQRQVGFLRTENRINVLLSRAKHGMYLIGNAATYSNVPMWADVYDILYKSNSVGTALRLCCPRHPETPIACSEPEDFSIKSPEGGCTLSCSRRLEPCGHKCQATCHSEAMHNAFTCTRSCPRIRTTCTHQCPKLCGESCGPCLTKVYCIDLPCGHTSMSMTCYQTQNLEAFKCTTPVERTLPHCGHSVTLECHQVGNTVLPQCKQTCTHILPCGHGCSGTCSGCQGGIHPGCVKLCGRPYSTCNHRCNQECHNGEACGSCKQPCEVQCPHSTCNSVCNKPCAPCIEPCTWSCPHQGACTLPCSAPCDRLPCNERCDKKLSCGHQCPSFCGEVCPIGYCQVCNRSKKTARVDLLEFRKYSEIDLDEAPIVVLGCGHFFTGETLDGLVGLGEVYHTDMSGNFTGMKNMSGTLAQKTPCCPDCKRSIRQFATRRYNRVINRAVMDEICKRFLIKGQAALDKLNKKLAKLETALATSRRSSSLGPHHTATTFFRERHAGIKSLEKSAESLLKLMGEENQPAKKLINAIATSQSAATGGFNSITQLMEALKLSHSAPGDQLLLGARLVILEAQQIQLMDAFMVSKSKGKKLHENALDLPCMDEWFKTCLAIMKDAMDVKLNRIVIATILGLAKIARGDAWTAKPEARSKSARKESVHIKVARDLLPIAVDRCSKLGDNDVLKKRVGDMVELYKPRHEEVTPEELASIRSAMVTGPHGMATHSGHWYNCVNGHPFAIGECGMPMETARCPECGAAIGGSSHRAVEGVYRAEEMETPAAEVRRDGGTAGRRVQEQDGGPAGGQGGEGCVVS